MKNRKFALLAFLVVAIIGGSAAAITYNNKRKDKSSNHQWKLTWSDEFTGENGSAVDKSKWTHEVGGQGWGNNEEEYYTEGTNNCYIQDNNLVIEAKREDKENSKYTSARIITKGKFDFKYGKVEIRAKIPYGQGIWPAAWMLGSNIDKVNWPQCGEIDIMENIGKEPKIIHGTMHGPGYSGSMGMGVPFEIGEDFKNDYHIYSVEWKENMVQWFVDGKKYHTMTPDNTLGNKWVFNDNFYLILNLAVGGGWPGSPDDTTVFPQKFYIDYVRVYK